MTNEELLSYLYTHKNARFKSGNYNYTKIAKEISEKGLDSRSVNTLRFLLADLVEKTDGEQEEVETKDVQVISDPLEIEWATNKYVYHSSSDTYSVFFKKGLAKFQGSTIRLLKRKYSDWDGNPDTINQICRAHGIPRKMLVELKTIFGWTHDSEPFTDEEVATRDVEDLADDVLQAKKYALEQKVNKQAEKAVYQKAERMDLIEKLEINPLAEKISSFYGEYKPVKIIPASEEKGRDQEKAAFCSPFDLHYGKYAWSEQSGKAYDRDAARKNLITSAQAIAKELILQGVSKVFIGVGSDFFHIDNYQGTTTKGTPQDLSGTPVQIMSEGYELMVHFIDIMRQVAPVELVLVQGNHDYMLSATLMMYLSAYYRNTDYVKTDVSFKYRQYRRWGTTLIGMTHGDGGKMADLPYSMLKEADNTNVDFRVWFVGHLHHEKAVEMKGSKFFQLSSLSGSDRWHHRNQYETKVWEKIAALFTNKTLEGVSGILDEVITNEPERLEAKAKLNTAISEGLNTAMSYQRDVLVTELQGNWLQRSWRPILMLAFGFIVVFKYFIWQLVMAFNPSVENFDLIPDFWNLLEIGIGGYVIGRSVEKTAETLTRNTDLNLLKKKDRKDKFKTDADS